VNGANLVGATAVALVTILEPIGPSAASVETIVVTRLDFGKGQPEKNEPVAELPSTQQSLRQPSGPEASVIPATEGVTAGVTFDQLLKANQQPWNWLTFGGTYQSTRNSRLSQITPETTAAARAMCRACSATSRRRIARDSASRASWARSRAGSSCDCSR